MSPTRLAAATLLALLPAATAVAQGLPLVPRLYVGGEAGLGRRGFEGDPFRLAPAAATPADSRFRNLDYGVFVGVEAPLAPMLFLGGEVGLGASTGRKTAAGVVGAATVGNTTTYAIDDIRTDPGRNYSLTARIGISPPLGGLAAYGILGYGGERVRYSFDDPSTGTRDSVTHGRSGMIYGLGLRYAPGIGPGVRAEYRHRGTAGSYDPDQYLIGVLFKL